MDFTVIAIIVLAFASGVEIGRRRAEEAMPPRVRPRPDGLVGGLNLPSPAEGWRLTSRRPASDCSCCNIYVLGKVEVVDCCGRCTKKRLHCNVLVDEMEIHAPAKQVDRYARSVARAYQQRLIDGMGGRKKMLDAMGIEEDKDEREILDHVRAEMRRLVGRSEGNG